MKESSDDKTRHYMNRIEAGVGRMSDLIEDLLSLAQVSRAPVQYRQVDLSRMAHEILQDLQARDTARRVECHVQDGLTAQADPRLIRISPWQAPAAGA